MLKGLTMPFPAGLVIAGAALLGKVYLFDRGGGFGALRELWNNIANDGRAVANAATDAASLVTVLTSLNPNTTPFPQVCGTLAGAESMIVRLAIPESIAKSIRTRMERIALEAVACESLRIIRSTEIPPGTQLLESLYTVLAWLGVGDMPVPLSDRNQVFQKILACHRVRKSRYDRELHLLITQLASGTSVDRAHLEAALSVHPIVVRAKVRSSDILLSLFWHSGVQTHPTHLSRELIEHVWATRR
jgi:hypothetical protein